MSNIVTERISEGGHVTVFPAIAIDARLIDRAGENVATDVLLPSFKRDTMVVTGWCVGYYAFTGVVTPTNILHPGMTLLPKSAGEESRSRVALALQRPDAELLFPLLFTLAAHGPISERNSTKVSLFYQPFVADKTGRIYRFANVRLDTLNDKPAWFDTRPNIFANHPVAITAQELMGADRFTEIYDKFTKKVLKQLGLR